MQSPQPCWNKTQQGKGCQKEGWTNHLSLVFYLYFNLTLVRGTCKRNKGINCCIGSCIKQCFWRLSGRNDGTQPYLYQPDQSRPVLAHEPCKETHERNTYRDDKAACSTLAVPLKRWDVEVGTVKWTWHRHGKTSYKVFSLNPIKLRTMFGIHLLTNLEEWTTLRSSPQKVLSRVKNMKLQGIIFNSGLTHDHMFDLGHGVKGTRAWQKIAQTSLV